LCPKGVRDRIGKGREREGEEKGGARELIPFIQLLLSHHCADS